MPPSSQFEPARAVVTHTWPSDPTASGRALEGWSAGLCSAITEVDVGAPDPGTFGGELRQLMTADVRLVQASALPLSIYRTAAAVALSRHAPFLLAMHAHDAWHVRQGQALLNLRSGDVALLDMAQPLELHFPRGCQCLFASVPRSWVGRWLKGEPPSAPRVAWREKGWGHTLSALFCQLAADLDSAAHYCGASLSDHLGAMLAAALEPEEPIHLGTEEEAQLRTRALAHMAEQIDRPGLCAATVASALQVSIRSLHRSFENSERTFAASLRQMRMQRAAELLQQPQLRSLNVAQIGARCGYPSPAHFGRAFALEYGLSPAAWRRAELHGQGSERD